jgi:hypothetical protein
MTTDTTFLDFVGATDLVLEISPAQRDRAWQQSQSFSHPSSRWRAYLNQLSLSAVLTWLQADYNFQAATGATPAVLHSCLEVTNGTVVTMDGMKLLLVPSEAIDTSELRVPQEWVDLPKLAPDYYLGVQVEPDEGWVRVWGYCTHAQLKSRGSYDPSDRAYSLDETDVIKDINVLWVSRQLCPEEPTKAAIDPLPTLPLAQAENLLQRLGNPTVLNPRLAVPFPLWGALFEHGGWRQRLYDLRLGKNDLWSIQQWLQTRVSEVAGQLGWGKLEFQPSAIGAKGAESATTSAILTRQLTIAGKAYELRVIPHEQLAGVWRFELQTALMGDRIPGGFKLRLLTEDLQPFENNEDVAIQAVERLFIEVAIEPREGLVWEIEPLPENYDTEILRF